MCDRACNPIAGNTTAGVRARMVEGNLIGATIDLQPLPNAAGVLVSVEPAVIGGDEGRGNRIMFNRRSAVAGTAIMSLPPSRFEVIGNVITGNADGFVGLTRDGTPAGQALFGPRSSANSARRPEHGCEPCSGDDEFLRPARASPAESGERRGRASTWEATAPGLPRHRPRAAGLDSGIRIDYQCGALPYAIRIGPDAREEMRRLPVRVLRQITSAMRRELVHAPQLDRKPRKQLRPDPEAGIVVTKAVWQLRIGAYRVFYDIDEDDRTVMIQRILFKGRKTTREILR